VGRFDRMISRRSAGEPIQYVLGHWPFRTLDLMVDRRVLIPRPETEVVAGAALDELHRLKGLVAKPLAADLGTGSGAIGLSLAAEHPTVEVWLSERSSEALEVARANLAGLGRPATRVNIVEGSWFEPFGPDLLGQLSVIVSNPPYVASGETLEPSVAAWEPHTALFAENAGLEDLLHLVTQAPTWLRPEGALVLELSPDQAEVVRSEALLRFSEADVVHDLAGHARAVVARHPRDAIR
ncbi:MAG: peptide chain release factor N(5)-glutamine methyltransferase, partial [Actinomycetota bacterium]|nr:peptide chain release factor N(5)-glutamine methyltransferase [Actinomycetota bacterium]